MNNRWILPDLVNLRSASGSTPCMFVIGGLMIAKPKNFKFSPTRSLGEQTIFS